MIREDFTFRASDQWELQAYRWLDPGLEARGVVQIAHGMVEHSLRYENFVQFLTAHGFIVYANDHRGHGGSYTHERDKGYFADKNGFDLVVQDLAQFTDQIIQDHEGLPIFLFGHSMGSLLFRRYVQRYDKAIQGLILSGTAGDPKLLGQLGLGLAKIERLLKGPRRKSKLMNQLIFGNHNKRFSPARTAFDFLTRDQAVVDDYLADKNCGFICTTSFYVDLLEGTLQIHRQEEVKKIQPDLPIFLLAGEEDPVGEYGNGVQAVYEQYLQAGLTHVSLKLYEKGRHEMLHEINRMEVYTDILNWMETILKGEEA